MMTDVQLSTFPWMYFVISTLSLSLRESKIAAKENAVKAEGNRSTILTCGPVWGKSKSSISPVHEVIKKTEAKHSLLYKSHTSLAGTKTQKKLSRERIL